MPDTHSKSANAIRAQKTRERITPNGHIKPLVTDEVRRPDEASFISTPVTEQTLFTPNEEVTPSDVFDRREQLREDYNLHLEGLPLDIVADMQKLSDNVAGRSEEAVNDNEIYGKIGGENFHKATMYGITEWRNTLNPGNPRKES